MKSRFGKEVTSSEHYVHSTAQHRTHLFLYSASNKRAFPPSRRHLANPLTSLSHGLLNARYIRHSVIPTSRRLTGLTPIRTQYTCLDCFRGLAEQRGAQVEEAFTLTSLYCSLPALYCSCTSQFFQQTQQPGFGQTRL